MRSGLKVLRPECASTMARMSLEGIKRNRLEGVNYGAAYRNRTDT
jgi:hypothetical protein